MTNIPSIGIDFLDRDHFAILNVLDSLGALDTQNERDYTDAMIHVLDYCTRHCREEEVFMKNINYPEYQFHCKKHQELVIQVKQSLHDTMSKKVTRTENLIKCKGLLCEHIIIYDELIGKFYKENGDSFIGD